MLQIEIVHHKYVLCVTCGR